VKSFYAYNMEIDWPVMEFCQRYGVTYPRHIAVIQMLVDGMIYEDICWKSGFSENTLRKTVYNIAKKAGVENGKDGIRTAIYQIALNGEKDRAVGLEKENKRLQKELNHFRTKLKDLLMRGQEETCDHKLAKLS